MTEFDRLKEQKERILAKTKEQPGRMYCDNCGAEQDNSAYPIVAPGPHVAGGAFRGVLAFGCKRCGGTVFHGTFRTAATGDREAMQFTAQERRLIRMALQTAANIHANNAVDLKTSFITAYHFDSKTRVADEARLAQAYRELKKRFKEKIP